MKILQDSSGVESTATVHPVPRFMSHVETGNGTIMVPSVVPSSAPHG